MPVLDTILVVAVLTFNISRVCVDSGIIAFAGVDEITTPSTAGGRRPRSCRDGFMLLSPSWSLISKHDDSCHR